ncbi:MAG: hypothetical protein JWR77_2687, partial [Rhizorhabdus sp.]|nr:hypothetical protein [Rhizorhabdus sp.]
MAVINRALVIGGGIGGLVAARALRLRGIEVDLIEKQPQWTVYGVGIIQPINALRALDSIGLAAACIARGGPYEAWRVFAANGDIIFDPPQHDSGSHFPTLNGITRPILHEILIDGAKAAGVDIRLGV